MGGGDEDEDAAIRAATTRPYSSPCKIVAERPKLTREPVKEVEVEAVAKETLRKARVEAGEGIMDASEATRGVRCER